MEGRSGKQKRLVPVRRPRQVLLEEPLLDRSQRRITTDSGGSRAGPLRLFEVRNKFGDSLMREDHFGIRRKLQAAQPRHDLDAQNRIAANIKEVVMNADTLDAEHLLPD